ncbi:hypothetical protein ABZ918_33920 [Streptomyces viridosporus]|uniref:hypothetical protein n=1 Tax=Streptomyces viridosporus TaxID=67581 RepID=UPI003323CFFC
MALFLFLILGAIVLGLVGVVLKGLFYLLILGVVVFAADLVLLGARWSRRSHTESPWLYARDRMASSESDRVNLVT